uniref:Putative ribonuclease H-like domain-containing protein n=1 Tax=Tanacetum cinerariifolium TaxID=118510 RepID=A0A6L2N753_TANCI|nr:putative ribonuclease H-like domain-containing protein [Tanacetum cinerariifolium]
MSYLSNFEEINGGYVAFCGNPKGGKIFGKGKIRTGKLDFDDVYFVKELKFNLFSVSRMCDKKNGVLFTDTEYIVLSLKFKLPDKNQVLLRVPRENNMYNVDLKNIVPSGDLTCLFAKATLDESNLWHRMLGPINFKTMNKLVKGNLVRGLPSKVFKNNHTCVACKKGKQHKASCKTKTISSVSQPLQRLHMDLFGPTFVKSLNKKSYCLVVTDDYSFFTWVFFLATKDETSPILKTFISGIENQLSLKVKIIRSDNGTELKNSDLNQFCRMKGIKRKFSVPRTPQQNRIAKRKNRTLIEAARTMLEDSLLPVPFWAEAVHTACYVQNRVLVTKPQNKTHYELLLGRTPSIGFMRPFGCLVTILNTLDSLGSGRTWLFDIDTLTKTMNNQPVTTGNQSNLIAGVQEQFNVEKAGEENVQQYVLFPLWSSGSKNPQNTDGDAAFGGKKHEFEGEKLESKVHVSPSSSARQRCMMTRPKERLKEKVLLSCQQALEDITYSDDKEDVGAEMQKVWVLVDLPNGKRAIGAKWVFRNKKYERGIVFRNKARLVAQGHTQEEGIYYKEVFSLVARIEAIRLFLAYASFMGFMVYQMDVKSAFLYGTIKEEVYVCQPLGFEDPDYLDKVYKVVKALYGLHQAPSAWYETFANYLLENGFQRGKIDKTLFIKKQKGDILLVQAYVDDIIFGYTNKDLYGKTTSTPIDTEKPLLKDPDGEDVDVHTYISMIDSLMYLTSSRPDIMFAVCACARFQVTPKASHLHAVKRIFRYLKGKPHLGLWYPKDSPFNLVAYSNSDYAGASLDRKSTTEGCQFLRCRLISLQCKKQTVFATSSTEAEYVAAESCYIKVNDVTRLQALVDRKKVIITEATIREALRLEDAESIDCLSNEEIFTELSRMGTSWNEFSSSMALAVICLSTGRKFNFSKYIFNSLMRNVDSSTKFYMYPRFLQLMIRAQVGDLSSYITKYLSPDLTKLFANMRKVGKGFSGVETPLFEGMIVAQQADDVADAVAAGVDVDDVSAADAEPSIPLPTPTTQPPPPSKELPYTSQRKNKLKVSGLRRLRKVGTAQRVKSSADTVMDNQEDASKQGEIIANIDTNEDVTLKDVAVVEKTAEIEENADVVAVIQCINSLYVNTL